MSRWSNRSTIWLAGFERDEEVFVRLHAPPEPLIPFRSTIKPELYFMDRSQSRLRLSFSDSLASSFPTRAWLFGTPLSVAAAIAGASIVGPAWLPLSLIGAVLGAVVMSSLSVMLKGALKMPVPPDFGGSRIIEMPFLISHDKRVFELYRSLAGALLRVSQQSDLILRDLALERASDLAEELEELASGRVVFNDTETWRLAYERLLRSPGTHTYRSVAVINTGRYWAEEPGKRSIRLNEELASAGSLKVERIAIIADELWPEHAQFPNQPIHAWLLGQHKSGISLRVVRQSAIASESDLSVDLGIYGCRALGIQEVGSDGRTAKFTLTFSYGEVELAEERWERLALYATTYEDLLKL